MNKSMISADKEIEQDDNDEHLPFRGRDFWFEITANAFFLLGSCLYVWVGVMNMSYEKEMLHIPQNISQADDDFAWSFICNHTQLCDDYIIADEDNDIWISRYQTVYFFSALCFVITGILECFYRNSGCLNRILAFLFTMAGCFGVLSAIFTEENDSLSAIFNSVSVHLFVLEAIGLAYRHSSSMNLIMKWFLYLGDLCFIVGTMMDVVLSYFWVFDSLSYELSKLFIAAACLWLACATIYTAQTIYSEYILMAGPGKHAFVLIATISVMAITAMVVTIFLTASVSLAAAISLSAVIAITAIVSIVMISL
mmetsp:Transcript_6455/g.10260  ORF Transcript_6455/g.10260 Transcript_6455/m.10260 type:complete len:310 (-) Transcript_6455:497-1426(-)